MEDKKERADLERIEDRPEIKNLRLNKPQHVKRLINQQINALRQDQEIDTETKARAIGYLSNTLLKSMEMGEMAERMEYVYRKLKEQEDRNKRRR